MNWYLIVLKKYATFEGRAQRAELWFFLLFSTIISLVLAVLDGLLGTVALGLLYSLAVFIPSLAVSVRRLHDIGKSGWWLLIALVPIIGIFVLLYFHIKDSQEDNIYGVNPKLVPIHD